MTRGPTLIGIFPCLAEREGHICHAVHSALTGDAQPRTVNSELLVYKICSQLYSNQTWRAGSVLLCDHAVSPAPTVTGFPQEEGYKKAGRRL